MIKGRGGGGESGLFGFVWRDEPGFVRFADPRGELLFSLFASDAVALLNFSAELVALTSDAGQIIIGELAPLFLCFAGYLLPVALNAVPVHFKLPVTLKAS